MGTQLLFGIFQMESYQLVRVLCIGVALPVLLCSCELWGGHPELNQATPASVSQTATGPATALRPGDRGDASRHIVMLSPEAEKVAGIQFGRAEEKVLEGAVKTTGEVLANANQVSHVTTPVTGRVVDIRVRVGDHVVTGQTLLTIHSTDIEQAEADLLQNEGQVRADLKRDLLQIDSDLATAVEQLKLSESTYNRMKSLFEQRIASQADYQAATLNGKRTKSLWTP